MLLGKKSKLLLQQYQALNLSVDFFSLIFRFGYQISTCICTYHHWLFCKTFSLPLKIYKYLEAFYSNSSCNTYKKLENLKYCKYVFEFEKTDVHNLNILSLQFIPFLLNG